MSEEEKNFTGTITRIEGDKVYVEYTDEDGLVFNANVALSKFGEGAQVEEGLSFEFTLRAREVTEIQLVEPQESSEAETAAARERSKSIVEGLNIS